MAEVCFREALAVARKQGALSWELRTAVSLVRLMAGQGYADEGKEILGPIYRQFTEGFETADLCAARSLLEGQ
jgi:predicted ATPase